MNTLRFIIILGGLSFARLVQAAASIVVKSPTNLLPYASDAPASKDTAGNIIANIISYGIGLTGVLAVMAITWAGIQMILASGDEEKTKKARNMMIYAFIGVVVAGLAYGVVKLITNLQLDTFQ